MSQAHGLAVHGNGPPAASCRPGTIPVVQPGPDRCGQRVWVQARQGSADGGLGRDGEVARSVVAGAERSPDRLGRVGRPFRDRSDRPGSGKHRGSGQGQDGDQWVAAATRGPGVGDGGQVGQQVRGFGVLELAGIGVGQLGQRGWDRR